MKIKDILIGVNIFFCILPTFLYNCIGDNMRLSNDWKCNDYNEYDLSYLAIRYLSELLSESKTLWQNNFI